MDPIHIDLDHDPELVRRARSLGVDAADIETLTRHDLSKVIASLEKDATPDDDVRSVLTQDAVNPLELKDSKRLNQAIVDHQRMPRIAEEPPQGAGLGEAVTLHAPHDLKPLDVRALIQDPQGASVGIGKIRTKMKAVVAAATVETNNDMSTSTCLQSNMDFIGQDEMQEIRSSTQRSRARINKSLEWLKAASNQLEHVLAKRVEIEQELALRNRDSASFSSSNKEIAVVLALMRTHIETLHSKQINA